LSELVALGPATNRAFLLDVIDRDVFAAGQATTDSLAELFPGFWARPRLPPPVAAGIAAALWCWSAMDGAEPSPWTQLRGFRVLGTAGRPALHELAVEIDGDQILSRVEVRGDRLVVGIDERLTLQVEKQAGFLSFACGEDGRTGVAVIAGDEIHLRSGAVEWTARVRHGAGERAAEGSRENAPNVLAAPSPGLVVEVAAAPGQTVAAGEPLVSIESMKLVMALRAPRAGRVSAVHVTAGETVKAGRVLVELEDEPGSAEG
jgi:acetyl/propionyl-CoA carboxylase alpha subunit